ncbi:MAG: energy transducer TonB [Treponema sp.]|nr:energy transducer TonB [Treponema sp.]
MSNTKGFKTGRVKLIIFTSVTLLHIILILTVAFNMEDAIQYFEPVAGVMRLLDLEEYIPPPPPEEPPPEPPEPETTTTETIAQHMIEVDEPPPPIIPNIPAPIVTEQIEYLPQHLISVLPVLPDDEIRRAIVYPPIAQRSGIEGTVFLELFIDSQGSIRNVRVLREDPPGRGFGEAAINAFRGIRGRPAEANGVPVAARYRYNITFRLN